MKWNKWVVVFMALCTMLTVTSCLGDDDKYELSQDEMKQAMKPTTREQCDNLARAMADRLKKDR